MIGYAEQLVDYFKGERPKKAQSIPASLFYRKNETMGITGVPFDLFISEKHKLSFRVGDHPLQNGSTISDHIQRELREVTIEGMFTNHPIKHLQDTNEVTFKKEYATSDVKSTMYNRALMKFNEIKALAEEKEPVRLVCSLEIYPKMVITEIDYDRDAKSGSSIRFSMTLREIVTVDLVNAKSTYTYKVESMESIINRQTAEMKNLGAKTAEIKAANELTRLYHVEVY